MINKNQMVGVRGGAQRNEYCNGGIPGCLRKFNAANCGAMWKTKGKYNEKNGKKKLSFAIKAKKRGRRY